MNKEIRKINETKPTYYSTKRLEQENQLSHKINSLLNLIVKEKKKISFGKRKVEKIPRNKFSKTIKKIGMEFKKFIKRK